MHGLVCGIPLIPSHAFLINPAPGLTAAATPFILSSPVALKALLAAINSAVPGAQSTQQCLLCVWRLRQKCAPAQQAACTLHLRCLLITLWRSGRVLRACRSCA